MKIHKVLNSSVVLTADEKGESCILLGKGIGYGKKNGDEINSDTADQIFIPLNNPDAKGMLELFSSIPSIYLELTQDVVQYAQNKLNTTLNEHIYLVLTDHLHFAVERANKGIVISNRVFWEIKNYYREEYEIGQYALQLLNHQMNINLPDEEAANIAFHIVNARKDPTCHYDAMQAAKIMGAVVNIISYSISHPLDKDSIHYSRFISHMQFFTERYLTDKLLVNENPFLFNQMGSMYPNAMESAEKVRTFFIKTYEAALPDEEIAYLALHIERLQQS